MAEIRALLKKAGADQVAIFEAVNSSAILFQINGAQYRIKALINTKARNVAQDERRAWRLIVLLVKAKLETAMEGATTIEREFFHDRLLLDGSTLGETIGAEIKQAHIEGRMPKTLMIGGSR